MNSRDSGHVFTYGSLMFDAVWMRVVNGRYHPVSAQVSGFDRVAIRDESYPALVRSANADASVKGVLYLDVAATDLMRLDRFEGDDYQRIDAPITRVDDGTSVRGSLYLYLRTERLLTQAWDEERFAQRHMAAFLKSFCRP